MSLTTCVQKLKKAGVELAPEDKSAILDRARALRGEGKDAGAAAVQAVQEQLAAVHALLGEPGAAPADGDAKAKAKADLKNALGDLTALLAKPGRIGITEEQEQALLPILARVFDAAFRLGHIAFKDAAGFVMAQLRAALGAGADEITIDHLQGAYVSMAGRYKDRGASSKRDVLAVDSIDELTENSDHVPDTDTDLERGGEDGAAEAPDVEAPVRAAGGQVDRGAGADGSKPRGARSRPANDPGVPAGGPAAGRERGDQPVHRGDGTDGPSLFDARADDTERGADAGSLGVQAETIADEQAARAAESGLTDGQKRAAQRAAESIPIKPGIENIRATLPYLLPQQQDDVLKAETRFDAPDGYGMLFTNSTGTGKTYTGLGVIKRFARRGKNDQLILVPDAKIMADWVESGKAMGLTITPLRDTKDAGAGITITTYANAGDNMALVHREWDLVTADEAHGLTQGKDGESTKALATVRAITRHQGHAYTRFQQLHADDLAKQSAMEEELKDAIERVKSSATSEADAAKYEKRSDELDEQLNAMRAKLFAARGAVDADVKAKQGAGRTRAQFLSATPFAYENTINWADGYLFDFAEGYPTDKPRGYNAPSPRDLFFMTHFGWRMRTGKLFQPDAKVDRGLMQRQFNGWLKKRGALSGRMLEVKADYDRKFVLVDSAIGNRIDAALTWLSEKSRAKNSALYEAKKSEPNGYQLLSDTISADLYGPQGHLVRRYLLEAIKAKESIAIIKKHLALGRKVVVFHDFKKGGARNPFSVDDSPMPTREEWKERQVAGNYDAAVKDRAAFSAALTEFSAEFPDITDGNALSGLISPIQRFKAEFPDVLLINGDEKKADLLARHKRFNDDAQGPIVALVQSAKNKGWSGHDTTGKYPRVLFNLGLPTQPTMTIQQEGRIYRVGQVSNAMFRYFNTGTTWERWAFAQTIARRASEAENLAAGEQARGLLDAFISGYEESDAYPPGHEGEGTGGKERDRALANVITEFDRAKAYYFGTQKKNSRTKSQEGSDYFATPEPVGLKMVQWLNLRGGESALEPSAGHGAIARWMPDNVERTAIEPSMQLRSRLALSFDGKIVEGNFEDHHVVNKYDGIVMNPPFGTAGRTAVDHLAKAATHLRDGGRIVALIPRGSADAKFDKWFHEGETRKAKPLGSTQRVGDYYAGDMVAVDAHPNERFTIVGLDDRGVELRPAGLTSTVHYRSHYLARIVASGPRQETFKPAEGLHLVADINLPAVTFERAGTGVTTRIVVLEKSDNAPQQISRDYTDITDINALFDRIEDLELRPRAKALESEPATASSSARRSGADPIDGAWTMQRAEREQSAIAELNAAREIARGEGASQVDGAIRSLKDGDASGAVALLKRAARVSVSPEFSGAIDRAIAAIAEPGKPAAAPAPRAQPKAEKAAAEADGEDIAVALGLEVVEHTTQKGKVLQGVIVRGMSKDQAAEVDPYTWRKDGGYFIRLEHMQKLREKRGAAFAQGPQPAAAERSTVASVRAEIAALFGATAGRAVTVAATVDDLPANLAQVMRDAGAHGLTLDKAHVYIVADRVPRDSVRGLLMHELGVHYGMDAPTVAKLTEQVMKWSAGTGTLAEQARWAIQAAANSKSTNRDEEVAAYMVQVLTDAGVTPSNAPLSVQSFLARIKGAMRAAARALGFSVELTPQDVVDYAYGSARMALRSRAKAGPSVQFAQAPQTDSEAFRKWFGDSKVVGAQGRPLVVYHGTTADFNEFKPGRRDAFYFAANADMADEYTWKLGEKTGSVMPVYLSMRNPLVSSAPLNHGTMPTVTSVIEAAKRDGHDGVTFTDARTMDNEGAVYVAFRPEQIKSAIGNRGTFDSENPDIRFNQPQAPLPGKDLNNTEREAFRRAGLGGKRTAGQAIRGGFGRAMDLLRARGEVWAEVRSGALDQFAGIRRAVEREFGGLPVDQDPYITARLANGAAGGVMRALLLHGQAQWAANGQHLEKKPGTRGLLDILQPLGNDMTDWWAWMIGNRAARLAKEGRENNFSAEQIKALQGRGAGKEAAFKAVATEFAAFKRSVLDVAEGAGLIDAEGRKVWDNADWVPFYRQTGALDEVSAPRMGRKGFSGQSSGIRKLIGGAAAINDPLENVLMNFSRLIDASLKNNALGKTVRQMTGTGVVERVNYDFKPEVVPASQIKKALIESGTPPDVMNTIPPEVFKGMAKMLALQAPAAPDIVRVMVGGKPWFYRVSDPYVLRALTSFVPFDFPGLGVMRAFKRVLTRTLTSTPEFMLRNWARDSVAAQAITPGFNPLKSIQGVIKSYRETGAAEAMMFAGASFQSGNVQAGDPTGTAKEMRRALRSKGVNAAGIGVPGKVVDSVARGAEHYFEIGDAIENANREAVYEATVKRDGGATAAAYEAKDVMDFSLRGAWAGYQILADVLPFFNARVQGLYRLGRSDPKRLALTGMMIAAASLLLAMANDGEDWYEELADWDKDTYWHFKIFGKHFRLPKPFEIGVVFATIPERLGRLAKGNDTGKKAAGRLAHNVKEQLAFDPVPQMFRPAMDAYFNWDSFRERPIENMGDERKLPTSRYSATTSDTARVASAAGGDVSDALGLSPKKLEFLVNGYLGTAGMYALGLTDILVTRPLTDKPPAPAPRLDELPVVRAFYREDPARATVFESDLYKIHREVDKIAATIKALHAAGRHDEANARQTRDLGKVAAKPVLDMSVNALGDLTRARDAIVMSRTMTPEEKRRRIDELQAQRNAIAKAAMTAPAVRATQ